MVRKPQTGKIKLCQLCIRIMGKSGPHLKEVVGNHYGKDMGGYEEKSVNRILL